MADPLYASSLVCGVCLDEYKDPRALPCLHTFCHDCLLGLHRRARGLGITCPCCREVCCSKPSELRRNFHVSRLQEMRPLLAMGIGLAEDFAGKARAQLAELPDEADLGETARRCRQELAGLREGQRSLEAFFDGIEAVVSREREAAREQYEVAKRELKAKRLWAKDCLARRSVSLRLIDCAKSARHQTLLDLIEEFRLLKCTDPVPPEPVAAEPGSSHLLPTESQVRHRLAAHLSPPPAAEAKSSTKRQRSREKLKQRRKASKQRRQRRWQKDERLKLAVQQLRARPFAAAAAAGFFTSGDDDDDSDDAQICVHPGLAGFMYYGED